MFQRGAHCIEMLHSNIHLHVTKLFCKLLMETLEAHAWPTRCNSHRLWPFWLLLAPAHMVSWSPLIPRRYLEHFQEPRARRYPLVRVDIYPIVRVDISSLWSRDRSRIPRACKKKKNSKRNASLSVRNCFLASSESFVKVKCSEIS